MGSRLSRVEPSDHARRRSEVHDLDGSELRFRLENSGGTSSNIRPSNSAMQISRTRSMCAMGDISHPPLDNSIKRQSCPYLPDTVATPAPFSSTDASSAPSAGEPRRDTLVSPERQAPTTDVVITDAGTLDEHINGINALAERERTKCGKQPVGPIQAKADDMAQSLARARAHAEQLGAQLRALNNEHLRTHMRALTAYFPTVDHFRRMQRLLCSVKTDKSPATNLNPWDVFAMLPLPAQRNLEGYFAAVDLFISRKTALDILISVIDHQLSEVEAVVILTSPPRHLQSYAPYTRSRRNAFGEEAVEKAGSVARDKTAEETEHERATRRASMMVHDGLKPVDNSVFVSLNKLAEERQKDIAVSRVAVEGEDGRRNGKVFVPAAGASAIGPQQTPHSPVPGEDTGFQEWMTWLDDPVIAERVLRGEDVWSNLNRDNQHRAQGNEPVGQQAHSPSVDPETLLQQIMANAQYQDAARYFDHGGRDESEQGASNEAGDLPVRHQTATSAHRSMNLQAQGEAVELRSPGAMEWRRAPVAWKWLPVHPFFEPNEVAPQRKSCLVCDETFDPLHFPTAAPTAECTHPAQTCSSCLQKWVSAQLDTNGHLSIKCPDCKALLSWTDMQHAAIPEVFAHYDTITLNATLNTLDDFTWCLNPTCSAGQLNTNTTTLVDCASCQFQQCLRCKTAWHPNETCSAYQARLAPTPDPRTVAYMAKNTKACPGPECGIAISKKGGCDHMKCQRCSYEFCWQCLAPYAEIRVSSNSAHSPQCPYYASGRNYWH